MQKRTSRFGCTLQYHLKNKGVTPDFCTVPYTTVKLFFKEHLGINVNFNLELDFEIGDIGDLCIAEGVLSKVLKHPLVSPRHSQAEQTFLF